MKEWVDTRDVLATPYDTPVPGYGTQTVNTLRLWAARGGRGVRSRRVQRGRLHRGHRGARPLGEHLPGAVPERQRRRGQGAPARPGVLLRLRHPPGHPPALQEARRISAEPSGADGLDRFADKVAIQLNDTHPALAVPELMRVLVDLEHLGWDEAWEITRATFGYTNHTVLPEALERWPVGLIGAMLPRHLEIIYEINRRLTGRGRAALRPRDDARARRMSIIDEDGERRVRMATLAIVGSHSVNGVAALHTEILERERLPRLPRDVAGAIQQQDQRHHAAALAAQEQPAAGRTDHRGHRGRLGDRPRGAPRARAAAPRRGPSARPGGRPSGRTRSGWPRPSRSSTSGAVRRSPSIRTRSSTCRSSGSTSTSASS